MEETFTPEETKALKTYAASIVRRDQAYEWFKGVVEPGSLRCEVSAVGFWSFVRDTNASVKFAPTDSEDPETFTEVHTPQGVVRLVSAG